MVEEIRWLKYHELGDDERGIRKAGAKARLVKLSKRKLQMKIAGKWLDVPEVFNAEAPAKDAWSGNA